MTTGAHALVFAERVLQSTARTCAVTMKLCLTAVGAAVAVKEKRKQIPTTPRMKQIIALGSLEGENLVGNLGMNVAYCSREANDGNQTNTEVVYEVWLGM